jgi:hypothetical protein
LGADAMYAGDERISVLIGRIKSRELKEHGENGWSRYKAMYK